MIRRTVKVAMDAGRGVYYVPPGLLKEIKSEEFTVEGLVVAREMTMIYFELVQRDGKIAIYLTSSSNNRFDVNLTFSAPLLDENSPQQIQ